MKRPPGQLWSRHAPRPGTSTFTNSNSAPMAIAAALEDQQGISD